MSDPLVIEIVAGIWQKVATAVTTGTINRLQTGFKYYQTYRDTGGTAPDALVGNTLPLEAVTMFDETDQEKIESTSAIDVYVLALKVDNLSTELGRVRVDL